jgi:heptaprenyl diphosphate synthase
MREVLKTDNSEIEKIIDYLLISSGKMLRPRMVYLTASLHPHDADLLRDMAVAIELIHLASLVHDDVIDRSQMRRGRDSLNKLWGNQRSVLTGDYLFATAFNLINEHNCRKVMESVSTTIQIMCSGEIKQLAMLFDTEISEADYYEKSYRKTACLFASSCKVGALTANMSTKEVSILEQFGLCLGYAYQIIDDVLDFVSESSLLGKPAGNDLLQGNITLPVIFAMQDKEKGSWIKHVIQSKTLSSETIPLLVKILLETGAIYKSIEVSHLFLKCGLKALDKFPMSPAIQELREMSLFLMEDYYKKLNCQGIHDRRPLSGNIH